MKKTPPAAQERIIDIVDAMPAADRKRFAEGFEHLVDELGAEKGAAPMLFEDEVNNKRAKRTKSRIAATRYS